MGRVVRVAVAQSGPIPDAASRATNVARLVAMLRQAAEAGAACCVFTECALTAFFPHWDLPRPEDMDRYFERSMPNADVAPLFAEARRLEVGFVLGYAELAEEENGQLRHYNSSVMVDATGAVLGKYRKTHLPGYFVPDHHPDGHTYQNLEKRYFDVGNLGWPVHDFLGGRVGMMICNDRRWAEPWRIMGLQGAECVMLGCECDNAAASLRLFCPSNSLACADNTPTVGVTGVVADPPHLGMFQNHLSMQAGAYQNACWVCAAAKAGEEEGVYQMGGSCIIAPTGEIVARATTDCDEVIVADLDLDMCHETNMSKDTWGTSRQPQYYGAVAEAMPPAIVGTDAPGMSIAEQAAARQWKQTRGASSSKL